MEYVCACGEGPPWPGEGCEAMLRLAANCRKQVAKRQAYAAAEADMLRAIDSMGNAQSPHQGANGGFVAAVSCQGGGDVLMWMTFLQGGRSNIAFQAASPAIGSDDRWAGKRYIDLPKMAWRAGIHIQDSIAVEHAATDSGAK